MYKYVVSGRLSHCNQRMRLQRTIVPFTVAVGAASWLGLGTGTWSWGPHLLIVILISDAAATGRSLARSHAYRILVVQRFIKVNIDF